MTGLTKGVAVAFLHILIVTSLGAKLLYDRVHRPRVWVRTGWIDPDMPIRGRYFTLNLQVRAQWFKPNPGSYAWNQVTLGVENKTLMAYKTDAKTGLSISHWASQRNTLPPDAAFLDQSLAFFLPEHAEFPRFRTGEELWAEVTIPKKGPPGPSSWP
jgi:hypothetical protein